MRPDEPTRRQPRPALSLVRGAAWVLYGVLVAAGALVQSPGALLWGIGLGLFVGSVAALLRAAPGEDLPPLPHPLTAGTVAACLPTTAAAPAVLGVVTAPVAAALVCLVAVLTGAWLCADPLGGPATWDEAGLRRRLAGASTAELLAEWHGVGARPDPVAAPPLWRARVRDLLIDEFTARDPDGTRAWLAAGPGEPPERHVGSDAATRDADGPPTLR